MLKFGAGTSGIHATRRKMDVFRNFHLVALSVASRKASLKHIPSVHLLQAFGLLNLLLCKFLFRLGKISDSFAFFFLTFSFSPSLYSN